MNLNQTARSRICMNCAVCCKTFSELVGYDTAKRFIMLDTDKITVKEIKTPKGVYYKVTYHFPCTIIMPSPIYL